MEDGRATKCDGCAATVAGGELPWCVQTCPAQALKYDKRELILAEAHERVAAIKGRFPNAQVYGKTQAGGLGLILVLPDDPETLDIPADPPPVPVVTDVWKNVVQPVSMGATALATIGAGVLGIIARRNHMAELRAIEEQQLTGVTPGGSDAEEVQP
jgi:formate dehydrogenase iron-sulfur subunit